MAAVSRLPVPLQVVDVHQQCDPSAWTSAAATPWQFLRVFSKAANAAPQAPVPLQRCLLQVVSTAQRLQVACPENQTHSTSWSATHLAPVAALLARAEDELVVELCEETIHSTLVSLRLHSGPDELVRLWPPAMASCHIMNSPHLRQGLKTRSLPPAHSRWRLHDVCTDGGMSHRACSLDLINEETLLELRAVQVLPWVLMLPHGLPSHPQSKQHATTAAAVPAFVIDTLTRVCRRPLEAWGTIEQLATAHAPPHRAGAQADPDTTRPSAGQLLSDASTAAVLPLFSMFGAALRRFRRTDASSNGAHDSATAAAAQAPVREADEMVWEYVAGAARLILPGTVYTSIFATGLLGLAAEELSALPVKSGPAGPRIRWSSPPVSEAGQGAPCSLVVTAGKGTSPMFLHLLQWLWETAREGAPPCTAAQGATSRDADRPGKRSKATKKRARSQGAPVPGSQGVLVAGRAVSEFSVEAAPGPAPLGDVHVYLNGSLGQPRDVPESRRALTSYKPADTAALTQAKGCAVQQQCGSHLELMRLLSVLDRACTVSGVSSRTAITSEGSADPFAATAACAAGLPDAHLRLVMSPCLTVLRTALLHPRGDGSRGAAAEPLDAGPGPKRSKKSSRRRSHAEVLDTAGQEADGSSDTRYAVAVAAAACFEYHSRAQGSGVAKAALSSASPASVAAWQIIMDVSGSKAMAAKATLSTWHKVALASVMLFLQVEPGAMAAGAGISMDSSLESCLSGTVDHAREAEKQGAVAVLLATAASHGSGAASATCDDPTAHAQPGVLRSAVKAAAAGDGAGACQLLSCTATRTLHLLPGQVLHSALTSRFASLEAVPDSQRSLRCRHAACLLALAEACSRQAFADTRSQAAGALQVPALLQRACSLALTYAADSASPAQPAALSFLTCFFQGLRQADGALHTLHPAAVQLLLQPADESLLQAALGTSAAARATLMPAACLRIGLSPQPAIAAARLLLALLQPSKDEPAVPRPKQIIAQQARVLAAVLVAARDTRNTELAQAAAELAAAARGPVLRLLVKPPTQVAELESSVDWDGVGQLALQCLQVQPLQVWHLAPDSLNQGSAFFMCLY